MKPIISPWSIYLINLFGNLKGLLSVALILLGCAVVALSIIWLLFSMDYEQNDDPIVVCKKYLKKSVTWLCVSSLLLQQFHQKIPCIQCLC